MTWLNILLSSYDLYILTVFFICALTPDLGNRVGYQLIDILEDTQVYAGCIPQYFLNTFPLLNSVPLSKYHLST